MIFDVQRDGDCAVVATRADVVASVVPELRPALRDLVRSGVRNMVIDLAGAGMIDSSGLGLLLSAFNSLRAVGGALSVVNASEDVLDLFRTLRINQHFPVSGA
jgi:anti-anti-sigma factor